MKWVFVILFCFSVHCDVKAYEDSDRSAIFSLEKISYLNSSTASFTSFLFLDNIFEKKRILDFDTIVDLVSVLLLLIITFLVILTPLTILSLWIFYSYLYVRRYRAIFSIKKWFQQKSALTPEHMQKELWRPYRKVYSNMLGFGISILAYTFFSIRFMKNNFEKMEDGLTTYFSFPFKVIDDMRLMETNKSSKIEFDTFWDDMFLIVIASFIFFFIGWLLGSFLVDTRLKMLKKKQASLKKASTRKEMFNLNVDAIQKNKKHKSRSHLVVK